jgi:hypothetical protein
VQDIEYTPFSRYIIEFLDIEPTQDDGINFGEWLHCVSTICMFEREQMVRYTFSFADTRQEQAVDEEVMRKLVRVVFASTNGFASSAGVMPMISKLSRCGGVAVLLLCCCCAAAVLLLCCCCAAAVLLLCCCCAVRKHGSCGPLRTDRIGPRVVVVVVVCVVPAGTRWASSRTPSSTSCACAAPRCCFPSTGFRCGCPRRVRGVCGCFACWCTLFQTRSWVHSCARTG